MWYVIQVMSGREGHTVQVMEKGLPDGIMEECFVPMRRLKKKYHGKWQEVTEKLFPGYIFLITERPQSLYEELKKIPAFTKMLGSCEEYFTPLPEEEVGFLRHLYKLQNTRNIRRNTGNGPEIQNMRRTVGKEQDGRILEVGVSQVVVEKERMLRIISGPLKNMEGQIQKINLHKRIAVVETEFMGNKILLHLGIEIVDEE